jgi:hypothetical protein
MCTKEEQNVMVKAIRKAGWVRSSMAGALMVIAIITGMWKLGFDFRAEVSDQIDNKIQIHKLETEIDLQEQLGDIRLELGRQDGKLDLILKRLPE